MTSPPLTGLRVVVTRAEHQAAELAEAFAEAGARVELLPLLEMVPPDDAASLERAAAAVAFYDWLVFSSANAVEAFLPLVGRGLPAGVAVAAVGPATAEALRSRGIEPAVIAGRSQAEGLVSELAARVAGRRVLLPQAADARPALAEGLRAAGGRVTAVVAYDKRQPVAAPARAAQIFGDGPLGWVTFTSPRIARSFAALFGASWPVRRASLSAASIGPVTSAELQRLGAIPAAEAARPGASELVAAVVAAAAVAGRGENG